MTPAALAEQLGLKTLATTSSDGRWTSIAFQTRSIGEPGYFEDVRAVTTFRERVAPWTMLGGKSLTVAAKLSLFARLRVWLTNLLTRRVLKANARRLELYWSDEAIARRRKLSQSTTAEDAPRA